MRAVTDQELYKKRIFQYFHETKFSGMIEDPDFSACGQGLLCSDKISISGKLSGNKITQISVQTSGCIIATACANMLAESSQDKTIDFVHSMEEDFFIDKIAQIQIQTSRKECAILALNTLKIALESPK